MHYKSKVEIQFQNKRQRALPFVKEKNYKTKTHKYIEKIMDALMKFESNVDIQLSAKTNDNARCRL